MKFKVTKEELTNLIDSLKDGELIHFKDRTLEGEPVEERKCPIHGNEMYLLCGICNPHPQPIEEIDVEDFGVLAVLHPVNLHKVVVQKLNELIRAYNKE